MTDSLALSHARALIDAESVTPARGAVFDVLEGMLAPLGFTIWRSIDGEAPDGPVENLLATRGDSGPHFAFAGHLDVVPPGEGWQGDPFASEIRGELLHGRGAVDMKGAIAAFVAALGDIPAEAGTISLIVTGDEEGPSRYGTLSLMQHMETRGIRPDMILVGEPTSQKRLGDMIKIGRRGSVNIWLTVEGSQGHVAYPHLADNPIPRLIAMLSEIEAVELDAGTDWFQPSNIEITDISVGNDTTNVIPGAAHARLSIRFNDLHSGGSLTRLVSDIAARHGGSAKAVISGEPFLTEPGALSDLVAGAIRDVTGIETELSTSGGTSDARFLSSLCPTVEFGLLNATMHKVDEAVAVADLEQVAQIYRVILERALSK